MGQTCLKKRIWDKTKGKVGEEAWETKPFRQIQAGMERPGGQGSQDILSKRRRCQRQSTAKEATCRGHKPTKVCGTRSVSVRIGGISNIKRSINYQIYIKYQI